MAKTSNFFLASLQMSTIYIYMKIKKGKQKKKEASRDQVQVKSFLLQATSSSQASIILDQGVKFPQDFFSILQKLLQDSAQQKPHYNFCNTDF